jgi:hypothetical protein
MVVSSLPMSELTWECLQNLVIKGYTTRAEFATPLVPEGPVSPALAEEFVMVCAAFFD